MKRLFLLALFAVCVMCAPKAQEREGWTPLFNGRNLSGWVKLGGKAQYKVENGELVGVSTIGQPNTFLATKAEYGDFILEYEFKAEEGVNSGVQLRSHSDKAYRDGVVYGYQCEIDSPTTTASIYDEQRRGWLYNEPKIERDYRRGEWNKVRVEAVGNHIRVWLNGKPTVDMIDDADAKGFIGLQVHEIGNNKTMAGRTIRWRNIFIKTTDLEKELSPEITTIPQANHIANYLSAREQAQGWTLLWNGKDMSGWKSLDPKNDMNKGWTPADGVLVIKPQSGAGDIITEKKYKNFELSIDFQITKGANSGIKYFISENGSIGCEFQLLDDENHPDAKMGFKGNRRLGSLYDISPAEGWKHADHYGWNTARIVVEGNKVEHWLNGVKILSYEKGNKMWQTLVSHSKFAEVKNFAGGDGGHILLQDHFDEVHFRNLKIREL